MKIIEKKLNFPYRKVKKIKWGVVGCGNYLENAFLPALESLKRSNLISVYSNDINRAKHICEKFAGVSAFSDYDEFLKSDIEIIYISSANASHYEQVIKAAKAKKNILCEKPLAINYQQAMEMYNICKENNVFLAINYKFRWNPLVRKTKELIDKGLLGKIISINCSFNIDCAPSDNFRFKPEISGGGALIDLGTHLIDLMRFFNGEIIEAKGYLDNVVYKSQVEDFANAILKFEKGNYGVITSSFSSLKSPNRIEITGHKGTITIENLLGKKNITPKMIITLVAESQKTFQKRSNDQLNILKDIQHACLNNEIPKINGFDGAENLRIIELIKTNNEKNNE